MANPDSNRALQFLRRACCAIQNYDEEGRALVPARAWPALLDDLGLQEGEDAALFLMDHVEPAGPGIISYRPMLEALGVSLPPPDPQDHGSCGGMRSMPGPGPQDHGGCGGMRSMQGPGPQDHGGCGGMRSMQGPGPQGHGGCGPMRGGSPGKGTWEGMANDSAKGPPLEDSIRGHAANHGALSSQAPSSPQQDDGCDSVADGAASVVGDMMEEDEESFWARRASAIKSLYHQWDCNQLSNMAFTEELQSLLGERVDLSNEDSEFYRVASKHNNARNMKFATLMSALRVDVRKTMGGRFGWGTASSATSYAGSYAGSVCGDLQTPSDLGSEACFHAAGRPTRRPESDAGSAAGKKHYHSSSSSVLLSHDPKAAQQSCLGRGTPARAPPPFAQHNEQQGPGRTPARAPPPFAQHVDQHGPCGGHDGGKGGSSACFGNSGGYAGGGGKGDAGGGMPAGARGNYGAYGGGYDAYGGGKGGGSDGLGTDGDSASFVGQRQLNLDPDFWSRTAPRPQQRNSAPSECGQSDAGSMYSQSTARNHYGHGNILTWGDDSRTITPERRRAGRQVVHDEKTGTTRASANSDIFNQRR